MPLGGGIHRISSDTARKALNRIGIVLRYAAAMGIEVDLQATEKAKALLGRSRHKPQNIPAMSWQDVPAFYQTLAEPTITHLALRLLILTGVRSAPLRHIHVDQIEGDVWTIPGEMMKGRKDQTEDFRVPLSLEARSVIEKAKLFERNGNLFPSVRKGVISDGTMSNLMKSRGMTERPHGFRSSLRTWLDEAMEARYEVAEKILAHTVGSSVERAYRRSDFLEQRRPLAEKWADHVTGQS